MSRRGFSYNENGTSEMTMDNETKAKAKALAGEAVKTATGILSACKAIIGRLWKSGTKGKAICIGGAVVLLLAAMECGGGDAERSNAADTTGGGGRSLSSDKPRAAEKTKKRLLEKSKAAEATGNINFFGFYTGMPKSDADALAAQYGLTGLQFEGMVKWAIEMELSIVAGLDGLSMFHEDPETHEVYAILFSLKDVQRITQGPNTVDELVQTVAKQVGDLSHSAKGWQRATIDGVILSISISPQICCLYDRSRAEAARRRVAELEKKAEAEAKAKTKAEREAEFARAKAEIAAMTAGKRAGETRTIALPGGVELAMVWCPPGTFMMGNDDRYDERPRHQVTFTKGFWMGKTEVTQAQWKSVLGTNPSDNKGDNLPVENVSWDDCQRFCKKTGLQLPTEAQWEYACRAGCTGPFAGSGNLDEMGWYGDNSGDETHPVGTKHPNAWGLYDMHGNVWEWCADWYGTYPSGAVTDPKGSSSGERRVTRGGGWGQADKLCTSSFRSNRFTPSRASGHLGFRLVRTLSES